MRSTLYVSASVAILLASLTAQTQGPRSTPDGIGQLVVQLSASDAESRAAAACALRQKARRAEAAIPALTRLLSDATAVPIVCAQFDSEVGVSGAPFRTSPGYEAGRALGAIGNAALESLLRSASDTNRDIRRNALRGLAAVREARYV